MDTTLSMTSAEKFEAWWLTHGLDTKQRVSPRAFKELAAKAWVASAEASVCTLPHAPWEPTGPSYVYRDGVAVECDGKPLSPAWMHHAVVELMNGNKIEAIKCVRNGSGLALKDSLRVVTHLEKNYKLGVYNPENNSVLTRKPLDTLTPVQFAVYHRFVTLIEAEYSELLDK